MAGGVLALTAGAALWPLVAMLTLNGILAALILTCSRQREAASSR
jgi:hypothetical protein